MKATLMPEYRATPKDAVLVVNAGASSLRYGLYSPGLRCLARQRIETGNPGRALQDVLPALRRQFNLIGAGHRLLHGGDHYALPVEITEAQLRELEQMSSGPGQTAQLAGVRAVMAVAPHMSQVACFDTAFHLSQSEIGRRFASMQAPRTTVQGPEVVTASPTSM